MLQIQTFTPEIPSVNGQPVHNDGSLTVVVELQGCAGRQLNISFDMSDGGAKFAVDVVIAGEDCNKSNISLISGSADLLCEVPERLNDHARRLLELQYAKGVSVLDHLCADLGWKCSAEIGNVLVGISELLVIKTVRACA